MAATTSNLPSTVEETLAVCPQFRIVVVGKSGIGKSSLISCVFNLSLKDIDIAHDRAGKADVETPYTSDENPRFILHDSQGFEPGDTGNWSIVERFLRSRSANAKLKDQVHAIWLCIETPRTGSSVEQTGDERLLSLARELEIPIIVVFTKFDILVKEHSLKAQKSGSRGPTAKGAAQEAAEGDFNRRVKSVYLQKQIQCVRISTELERLETFRELTDITRQGLHGIEGDLWVPWAAAQQISARQKVEESIREGCKKYWLDLGKNTFFQDQRLIDCLSRLCKDIIQVWNFNDPDKLLSTREFFSKTIELVEEFSSGSLGNDQDDWLSKYSDITSLVSAIGTVFAPVVAGVGISVFTIKFLYRKYQAASETARYLGAYIIDLTLVLHRIFMVTLPKEPPRILLKEVIDDEMQTYAKSEAPRIHPLVRNMGPNPADFEQKIADLIRGHLS